MGVIIRWSLTIILKAVINIILNMIEISIRDY
jgi:hypothetical protein